MNTSWMSLGSGMSSNELNAEMAPTGLCVMVGFVYSQLGFAGVLQSSHVHANSHHLANLVKVDG